MLPLQQPPEPGVSGGDGRNVLFCLALFLLAVVAVNPLLDRGINDDWAYSHIAREFALSGHIVYNGWPAMMLLPQIAWAALFIKLFGFSFLAVRLSTVVLGALLVPLLYRLGRESGLEAASARFLTLLTVLSPLVLPETVSFMSDVPALFLFILTYYGAIKAWKAGGARDCLAWAALIAVAGVLSGMDRQVYWIAPLTFLPAIAWIQRRNKRAIAGLSTAWLLVALSIAGCIGWFNSKPYTLAEDTLGAFRQNPLGSAIHSLHMAPPFALTMALILLPLLIAFVVPGFRYAPRKLAALALAGVAAGEFKLAVVHHHKMPVLGDVLTEYGILTPDLVAVGYRPIILGPVVRDLLTSLALLCVAGCLLALWNRRREVADRCWKDPAAPATIFGIVFLASCFAVIELRSTTTDVFDRYLIPFLPVAGIPLLRHYQESIRPRLTRWSWAMLALFALYAVATTHDSFATARAQVAATGALEQAGIPRSQISAGFEYEGWTQLEFEGHLNNPQIARPAGAYRPVTCVGSSLHRRWWAPLMPAVHARYLVMLSRFADLEDAPASPVGYTTWLPPARRQIFTQMVPGGRALECR